MNRSSLLVRPEELETLSQQSSMRILDARAPQQYQRGHLPSAVNIAVSSVTILGDGIRLVAPQEIIERLLSQAGVDPDMTVVIYSDRGGLHAAYLFWVLEYYGHPDVRLLDGGIEAFLRAGGSLTQEIPRVVSRTFQAHIVSDRRATGGWLLAHLDDPRVQIVDNRSSEEYNGQDVYARRGGRIPSARSGPWDMVLNADLTFKRREALEAIYREIDLDPERTTVNYCQSGVRAAHAYFTQRLLGFPDPRVYDASWAEWGNDDRFPIER